MKRIYKYFSIVLTTVALVSCDDFIEENRYPLDAQTDSPEFWDNPSNVEGQCNALYNNYYGYGNGDSNGQFYYKTLNDDQADNSFENWANLTVPASDGVWSNHYSQIRRCNYIISNVRNSILLDNDKKNFEGIARLNRAWQYFQLVRMYGDVQWINIVVDPANSEMVYATRDDRDMVMDSVLADLNYACNAIATQASKTRWSRDMANAMKADVCLYEGTFCKYRTQADNGKAANEERASKYLDECILACENIMDANYSLNPDYQTIYNSVSLSNNPEAIFFKEYKNNLFYHSLIAYTSSSTQISGLSKDAFDTYLFKDGKPKALTAYDATDEAKIEYSGVDAEGKPIKATEFSIAHLLDVRDARLAKTTDPVIYFDGMTWSRFGSMQMSSSTGYGVRKYDNYTDLTVSERTQTVKNFTCAPIYWLSVIYCNYAEAKAERGTITQTDLDNTINKLYARAELPTFSVNVGFSDPANNMGVTDLIWEIRRCRRCELIMDNWYRYWDLVRWHQLDKLDSRNYPNILLGANISQYFDYVEKYNADVEAYNATVDDTKKIDVITTVPNTIGNYIDGTKGKVRIFEAKQYQYPIASGQIGLNDKLTQNPGW